MNSLRNVRTVAFYLPQFHAIPENNAWWGEGFTEWVSVRNARRQYPEHPVPSVPGVLGEYDLSRPEMLQRQSELAREGGVDAFCIYFYWFSGKRLLDGPTERWRKDPTLLPYCLSWANENWTRRWDGRNHEILAHQRYDEGYEQAVFQDLLPHFRADHYLKVAGCPVLLVHRSDLLPDAQRFSEVLRRLAAEAGLPGLHLVAAETKAGLRASSLGFDALAEFPPVGASTLRNAWVRPVAGLSPTFEGRLMSYDKLADSYARRREPRQIRYRCVAPGWDNTPRRQERATIYAGASPARYSKWLEHAREREAQRDGGGLVFINAWNEWGEGAYLEPDGRNGDAYLRATAGGHDLEQSSTAPVERRGFPSQAQVRSILRAAAGSVLGIARTARNAWR